MADVFGVTHADVGAHVPALFPQGFTETTKPTRLLVETWIATADTIATMAITAAAGGAVPDDDDPGAGLARQYIINYTLAYVMRAVYAGADPLSVKAAADQFAAPAADLLAQLIAFGTQAAGSGVVFNRVLGRDESLTRDLVITDDDLGGLASPFPGVSRRRQF